MHALAYLKMGAEMGPLRRSDFTSTSNSTQCKPESRVAAGFPQFQTGDVADVFAGCGDGLLGRNLFGHKSAGDQIRFLFGSEL
jgi:hypothetical protein